jgi:hypothetical protein
VKISTIDSAFERALSAEIAASELLRIRVLAVTLAVLVVADAAAVSFCSRPCRAVRSEAAAR